MPRDYRLAHTQEVASPEPTRRNLNMLLRGASDSPRSVSPRPASPHHSSPRPTSPVFSHHRRDEFKQSVLATSPVSPPPRRHAAESPAHYPEWQRTSTVDGFFTESDMLAPRAPRIPPPRDGTPPSEHRLVYRPHKAANKWDRGDGDGYRKGDYVPYAYVAHLPETASRIERALGKFDPNGPAGKASQGRKEWEKKVMNANTAWARPHRMHENMSRSMSDLSLIA